MTACRTRSLAVAYDSTPVLTGADLEVPRGSIFGIVGPNGAGKSTLIKAVLGLVPTLAGTAEIFGQPLDRVRQRVAYMPQSAALDPDFPVTVADVVLMGTYGRLGWFGRPGRAEREGARRAMTETGVADLARRGLGELSGGQRQRVLLARALAQRADLYFMDEPFAGIDARSQEAIVGVLGRVRDRGGTVVLVHHDLGTVARYCDHVALLDGAVVAQGPVAEAFTPQNIARTYGLPAGAADAAGWLA